MNFLKSLSKLSFKKFWLPVIISILAVAAIAITLIVLLSNSGNNETVKELSYTLSDDGTYYSVAGIGTCTDIDVIIPDTYKGLPVKSVLYSAFLNCRQLTSVVIGNEVTSIGVGAFAGCDNLISVTIGENVTEISKNTIIFNGDYATMYSAFPKSTKLIEVVNKSSLNITAGSSDNGMVAYYAKQVITDEKDRNIIKEGEYIFYNDNGSYYLMGYTGKDNDIRLPDDINGNPYKMFERVFHNCTDLKSIEIPNGITEIPNSAFNNCISLDSIIIPDSVTTIGAGAFLNCSSLKNVIIPDSVTAIEGSAFSYCSSLKNIIIPDSVTTIGAYAFSNCSSLKNIIIPDSVTYIDDGTFLGCHNLTSITIGSGMTSIGGNDYFNMFSTIFYECYKLVEIVNKSSLDITAGSSNYSNIAYYAKQVISSESESNIINQGDYIFYNDNGNYYLLGYTGTDTDIELPENINGNPYEIYQYAFYNRIDLQSIQIPSCVTAIGDSAFKNCHKLIEVINKSSLNITSDSSDNGMVSYYAKQIITDEKDSNIINKDEYIFYNDNGRYYLLKYICESNDITLPDNINGRSYEIYQYAFYNCDNLTSIKISNNITGIGDSAFENCRNFKSITMSNNVTYIGNNAFSHCSYLPNIEIPNSIENFGNNVFEDCLLFNYTVNGNSLFDIPYATLTSLTDEVYLGTKENPYLILFSVTNQSLTNYTINEKTRIIYDDAFNSCKNLVSIDIPNNIVCIGDYAFYYCDSLTSITFEDPNGWYVTDTENTTNGTDVALTDASQNATYLTSTYCEYYWYKNN